MLTCLLVAVVACTLCVAEVDMSNKQSNQNEIIPEDGDPKAEAFKLDSLLNELHSSQQEQGPLWTRGTAALPGWGNMYDMYQQHQDDESPPDSQFSDGHSNKADDAFNAIERGGTALNYVQSPDNAPELDGYDDPWDDKGRPHHSQSNDRSEMNEDLDDGGQSFEDPKQGKQPKNDGGGRDGSGMIGNMGMYNMPGAMPWGGLNQQQKYLPTMSQQKLYNRINPMQNQMYGYGSNFPFWGNQQPWQSMYPTQLGLSYQGYGGMQGFGQMGAPMMGGHMLGGFNQFGSGFNQMAGANNQGFNKMAGTEQQGFNQAASQFNMEQNPSFPTGFTQQSHKVEGQPAHLKEQQPPAGQQQQSHRQQPQQNPNTYQQQHQYPQQTFKHQPSHGLHQTHPQRQHEAHPLRQHKHQTQPQQLHHPQHNRQHERPHHPQHNRQHERPHHPQRNRQHERPHHPQRNRQQERPHHSQRNRQHERLHQPQRNRQHQPQRDQQHKQLHQPQRDRLHRPQAKNQLQSQHQGRPERQHQTQPQRYQRQQSQKHLRHQPSKHQSHNFEQHERLQNGQQQRQHLNQQQQPRRHQQQLHHQQSVA